MFVRACTAFSAGLAAALALTGCLPEGEPGIGERWLEGRGITALSVPGGEAPGDHVVFARADRTQMTRFGLLHEIFTLGRGGQTQRLADQITFFNRGPFGEIVAWDARSRIWAFQIDPTAVTFMFQLRRIDPTTGSTTPLGEASAEVAPDGKTIVVHRPDGTAEAQDVDGHVQPLGAGVGTRQYVGSSLFFSSSAGFHQLALPPLSPPRLLVARARSFSLVPGHDADQLFLVDVAETTQTNDRIPMRKIVLVRGQDPQPVVRVLAEGRFLSPPVLSAEGDRVCLLDRTTAPNEVRVRIIDLPTGAEQTATYLAHDPDPHPDRPPDLPSRGSPEPSAPTPQVQGAFRPQTRDLWIFQDTEPVAIHTNGALSPIARSGRLLVAGTGFAFSLLGRNDVFTSDGRFWTFRDAVGRIRVGDARDPLAPEVLDLSGPQSHIDVSYREIDNARRLLILTEQYDGNHERNLRLGDLESGQISSLARNVGQIQIGATRVIAIVDKLSDDRAPGRLVSIDLATGAATRLADNVNEFRLSPVCPTCDPTAPGVGLTYVVQARLPYRHDGLWRATLP